MRAAQVCVGIDVAEGGGLIVESDFDDFEGGVPSVDLAPATFKKSGEAGQHGLAAQAEDGMRLITGAGDRERRVRRFQRSMQALYQVGDG